MPGVAAVGTAADFAAIDWARPWLAPWRALGEPLAQRIVADEGGPAQVDREGRVARALNTAVAGGAAGSQGDTGLLHFVAASALPPGVAYEAHIATGAGVPTRDNLHDFFNGLMWLHQPALKRRLNALQAGAIAAAGIGATRGPLRDALTLFDESGAWLDGPPPRLRELGAALAARDWRHLFLTQRDAWAEVRLHLFGHAVLERLVRPYKAVTVQLRLGPPDTWIDEAPAAWAAKPFLALPVLGVPGWWPGNEVSTFYDDAGVFRPARPPG